MEHNFDLITLSCTRCGLLYSENVELPQMCITESENVVSLYTCRARRELKRLLEKSS